MEIYLGIDIGSSNTKGAVVDGSGELLVSHSIHTRPLHAEGVEIVFDALLGQVSDKVGRKVTREDINYCVSTGYGRNNVEYAGKAVTEITCHARGAAYYFPGARTVIDIGGQDSKVIGIDGGGKVTDFVMNEKCAAGTGRFLEAACRILKVPLEALGELSGRGSGMCKISSTCVVFAESEIISKLAEGVESESIIRGIHFAMVSRLLSMGKRVGVREPVVFSGGVARNRGMVKEVVTQMGIGENAVAIPAEPKIVGALGAALIAKEQWKLEQSEKHA